MEKKKKLLDFKITVMEKTDWGLIHKTFSDNIKVNRANVIAEAVEYISKNFKDDYIKAIQILRKNKGSTQV